MSHRRLTFSAIPSSFFALPLLRVCLCVSGLPRPLPGSRPGRVPSVSHHPPPSITSGRAEHPDWTNETQITAEAERQYNEGAKLFFTETLRTAKKLRPKGKFGFYEYPMDPSPDLLWLWQEVIPTTEKVAKP